VRTADGYGHMQVHLRKIDGRLRVRKVVVEIIDDPANADVAVTQRMLATAPLVAAEAAANAVSLQGSAGGRAAGTATLTVTRAQLVVPDVRPYPDQFWEDVAATYIDLVLVRGVTNPAVAISERTGAPVPTVRGWIAKCRQLGLIAQGTQGRRG
jgi:hypothetical protein